MPCTACKNLSFPVARICNGIRDESLILIFICVCNACMFACILHVVLSVSLTIKRHIILHGFRTDFSGQKMCALGVDLYVQMFIKREQDTGYSKRTDSVRFPSLLISLAHEPLHVPGHNSCRNALPFLQCLSARLSLMG